MSAERRWFPSDADYRRIWEHLQRQRDVAVGWVKLDDGRVVRDGHLAEGEER